MLYLHLESISTKNHIFEKHVTHRLKLYLGISCECHFELVMLHHLHLVIKRFLKANKGENCTRLQSKFEYTPNHVILLISIWIKGNTSCLRNIVQQSIYFKDFFVFGGLNRWWLPVEKHTTFIPREQAYNINGNVFFINNLFIHCIRKNQRSSKHICSWKSIYFAVKTHFRPSAKSRTERSTFNRRHFVMVLLIKWRHQTHFGSYLLLIYNSAFDDSIFFFSFKVILTEI